MCPILPITSNGDDLSVLSSLPVTYNVILGYSTFENFPPSDNIALLITKAKAFFEPKGINLNFVMHPMTIPVSEISKLNYLTFKTGGNKCIMAFISNTFNPSKGAIGGGRISAQVSHFNHELGHALGLYHTFEAAFGVVPNDNLPVWLSRELVKHPSSTCSPNCMTAGDLVCDTPVDPRPDYGKCGTGPGSSNCNSEADFFWNKIATPNCAYNTNHTEKDKCGLRYSDDSQYSNFMGYSGCNATVTNGQLARMLLITDTKYQGAYPAIPSYTLGNITINTPTEYIATKYINGNVIINSSLKLTNTSLQFLGDNKIIINPGGSLIVDNSSISGIVDDLCLFTSGNANCKEILVNNGSLLIKNGSHVTAGTLSMSGANSSFALLYKSTLTANTYFDNVGQSLSVFESQISGLILATNSITLGLRDSKAIGSIFVNNCNLNLIGTEVVGQVNVINAASKKLQIDKGDKDTYISYGGSGNETGDDAFALILNDVGTADIQNLNVGPYGILAKKVNLLNINNSYLNIGSALSVGIKLENVPDFDIFSNNFNNIGDGRPEAILYNAVGYNNNNLISSNYFNNFYSNIFNNATNGNMSEGLKIECNTFQNSIRDIVAQKPIASEQGSDVNPAGNDFHYGSLSANDISSNSSILYHFFDIGSQKPISFNNAVTIDQESSQPTCNLPVLPPSNNPNIPYPHDPITPPGNDWNEDEDDVIPVCTWHYNWPPTMVNPGVTPGIVTDVLNLSPNVPYSVFYQLMEYSTSFTEQDLTSILIANPALLLDNYIYWQVVHSGSFSTINKTQILNAFQPNHSRIVKRLAWGRYHYAMAKKSRYNLLKSNRLNNFSEAQYRTTTNYNQGQTYVYQVVSSYIREGAYNQALAYINSINVAKILDPYRKQEFIKYKSLMEIILPIYSNNGNRASLSSSEYATMEAIASSDYGIATYEARDYLTKYYHISHPPLVSNLGYQPLQFRVDGRSREKVKDINVDVVPNPATNIIDVNIDTKFPTDYMIVIKDALGRKVLKMALTDIRTTIDISELTTGIYYHSIIDSSNSVIRQGKLIVTK